jgi:hypothetical protein
MMKSPAYAGLFIWREHLTGSLRLEPAESQLRQTQLRHSPAGAAMVAPKAEIIA